MINNSEKHQRKIIQNEVKAKLEGDIEFNQVTPEISIDNSLASD